MSFWHLQCVLVGCAENLATPLITKPASGWCVMRAWSDSPSSAQRAKPIQFLQLLVVLRPFEWTLIFTNNVKSLFWWRGHWARGDSIMRGFCPNHHVLEQHNQCNQGSQFQCIVLFEQGLRRCSLLQDLDA